MAVMECGRTQVVADAGPYGGGGAGHSHSDTLSFVARRAGEEILIDCGTFTYTGDPARRDWFRGSAAHNTIRVDEKDQAAVAGPFRWAGRPRATVLEWNSGPEADFLDASCACEDIVLRRRILFSSEARSDCGIRRDRRLSGRAAGGAVLALGTAGAARRLRFSALAILEEGGRHGWRSPVYGRIEPGPVLRVAGRMLLPAALAAAVDLAGVASLEAVTLAREEGRWTVRLTGGRQARIAFHDAGMPRIECGADAARQW